MRKIMLTVILFLSITIAGAQTKIKMTESGGVFVMPCIVNGLSLNFIFDTGASNVSISLTEAAFMLKNGYLSERSMKESEYYKLANGDISEGTKVVIDKIEIGDIVLRNIEASIVHELNAPLLLGQSALNKFRSITFDYSTNTLVLNSFSTVEKSVKAKVNNSEASKLKYLNKNIYCVPDDDVIITNALYSKNADNSITLQSFTYSNATGYKLKYAEVKFTINGGNLNSPLEKTINIPFVVSDGDSRIFDLTEQNIVVLENQTVTLSIIDWDIQPNN